MLAELPYDLLEKIVQFQKPEEIIALYKAFALYKASKNVIQEMIKHTNLTIKFTLVLFKKEIKWFESKNIKVKLLEEYEKDSYGNEYWYRNGELHRENDLPAAILSDGTQYWCKNGDFHRENDLPAIIGSNGCKKWYKNGKEYRLQQRYNDLPGVNRHQEWSQNGHRLYRDNDLPAVIHSNGYQAWY